MPDPPQNSLKSFEDAPTEEIKKGLWMCSECGRLHGYWIDECPCRGRLYPERIDRSHIARGYVMEEL